MIRRLLIANRGEIARRIQRTCRAKGIETVAVFSDADADALFVKEADQAVRIGPAAASESYLSIEKLIAAARTSGADAVHPGYGFLSENAAFARAVIGAGLTWVGPAAATIDAMGSKQRAKGIAIDAGVPVVPGYQGEDQSDAVLVAAGERIGTPLLVKASAGGGGKGMRVVNDLGELPEAIVSARREALSSFGDDTLLLERYVQPARHIEVQVLGDGNGGIKALFERECSLQRRHQKVVEEAPSPSVTPELRAALCDAAEQLAGALNYAGAGTVEFIAGPDDSFYFLEVNTRLQVEHPVTECVTGLDLVAEQLRIAEGRGWSAAVDNATLTGHAIEARIYAEDPATGFLPAAGELSVFALANADTLDGVRFDTGVTSGDRVSVHYDPMLAKLVAWGADRTDALRRLRRALSQLDVAGIANNVAYLGRVLAHPDMVNGTVDTGWLERHEELNADTADLATRERAAIALTLWESAQTAALGGPAPATLSPGFRIQRYEAEVATWRNGDGALRVDTVLRRDGTVSAWVSESDDALPRAVPTTEPRRVRVVDATAQTITWEDSRGVQSTHRVARFGHRRLIAGANGSLRFDRVPRFQAATVADDPDGCTAPMPGIVVTIHVAEGDHVSEGQPVAVIEAMKMEHTLSAPRDGVVKAVRFAAGDSVRGGDAVLVLVGE
ncbi:MAG: acetyl/propionyl-CoA carboxylase alpha subunit [Bradymonadia bacterium]|jgi:acetyl/propionyl-CoA carboxylase alpha subunit